MARCPSRCQPSSLFALGTGNAQALARVLKNANIIIIKYQISQQYQFSISDHMDPRCHHLFGISCTKKEQHTTEQTSKCSETIFSKIQLITTQFHLPGYKQYCPWLASPSHTAHNQYPNINLSIYHVSLKQKEQILKENSTWYVFRGD